MKIMARKNQVRKLLQNDTVPYQENGIRINQNVVMPKIDLWYVSYDKIYEAMANMCVGGGGINIHFSLPNVSIPMDASFLFSVLTRVFASPFLIHFSLFAPDPSLPYTHIYLSTYIRKLHVRMKS